jgi:hypothetical protein
MKMLFFSFLVLALSINVVAETSKKSKPLAQEQLKELFFRTIISGTTFGDCAFVKIEQFNNPINPGSNEQVFHIQFSKAGTEYEIGVLDSTLRLDPITEGPMAGNQILFISHDNPSTDLSASMSIIFDGTFKPLQMAYNLPKDESSLQTITCQGP